MREEGEVFRARNDFLSVEVSREPGVRNDQESESITRVVEVVLKAAHVLVILNIW